MGFKGTYGVNILVHLLENPEACFGNFLIELCICGWEILARHNISLESWKEWIGN